MKVSNLVLFLRTMKRCSVLALLLALGACSSSDNTIPPSPLPDFDSSLKVDKAWSRQVGDGAAGKYFNMVPAIAADRVYAASADGEVLALDKRKGKVQWRRELDDVISGATGFNDEHVFVGTLDGVLVALRVADGKEAWRAQLTGEVLAPPVADGQVVIAQTADGRLAALDQSNGERLWLYDISVPVVTLRGTAAPVISGDLVVAAFSSGKMAAIDLDTGVALWERIIAVPEGRSELERLIDIDGRFWVEAGVIHVVAYQGRLSALDLRTGRPIWSRPFSSLVGLSEGLGSIYITEEDSVLHGVRADNGESLWQLDSLRGRMLTAPVAVDQYLVVGDFEGYLHWIRQSTGDIVARVKVDGDGLRAAPVAQDGRVYVQGNGGALAVFRIERSL